MSFRAGEFGGVGQPVRRAGAAGLGGDVTPVGLGQDPAVQLCDLGLQAGHQHCGVTEFGVLHGPGLCVDESLQPGLDLACESTDRVSPVGGVRVFGHVTIPALPTDSPAPISGLSTGSKITEW